MRRRKQSTAGRTNLDDRLRRSQSPFFKIFDASPDPISISTLEDGTFLDVNESFLGATGYERAEIIGRNALDLKFHPAVDDRTKLVEALRIGPIRNWEYIFVSKSGENRTGLLSAELIDVGGQSYVLAITKDITERRRAELDLRRVNRTLLMISHCKQVLVRAQSEEELFKSVCKSAVEAGGYRMAWVGVAEHDAEKSVRPVAFAGAEEGYLKALNTSWADTARGQGTAGTAIRTGKYATGRILMEDPAFAPRRDEALRRGFASSISLPLCIGGHTLGALTIYSVEPDAFNGQEIKLLSQLADDLAFGLEAMRAQEERKRTEDKLREYEKAVEGLEEMLAVVDLEYRYVFANRAFLKYRGMEAKQIMGLGVADVTGADLFESVIKDRLDRCLRGEVVRYELKAHTPALGPRDLFVSLFPIEGPAGVDRVAIIVDDITERKRAQEEQDQSREVLKDILDTIPQRVFWKDRNLSYLGCNRAFATDAGPKDPLGIVGKNDYDLAWKKTADLYRSDDKLVMDHAMPRLNFEEPQSRPDGSLWWLRTSKLPMRNREGKVIGVVGTYEDITDRKQAEEALRKLQQAVDASGEVVFMTDRDGTITSINPEFTRLYGYTREEVVGKVTPRILRSGLMQLEDYDRFWKAVLGKDVARGEVINKAKDGHLITVYSSVNAILDEQANIRGFLAIQRDVTGWKHLEEQFRQAQKMEAVGRLAGGVAHDFNNLLTIINGYSQLLLERVEPIGAIRDQLAMILQAGERAASLTRQLLAFSRKQVLEPRVLNLNNVLDGMDKMLRRLIGEDVDWATIPGSELGQVKADPAQIEQVIMNLAVNARDAMPNGGKLTIETQNVILDDSYASTHVEVMPGRYVMLAVSDTGHGMDPEALAHAFEPFFTTKEQGKGTGLGLSTVYGIVRQTGGHVTVYSEVGRGTTFKVYLPRLDQPITAAQDQVEDTAGLSGSETILVVEDEPGVRSLVRSVLVRHGYDVLLAGTAEEATKMSGRHAGKIQLLLTDVIMPGFSGKELANHLSFLRPDMKVLFISGYTADAIAHHEVVERTTRFLQKPFTTVALLRKVREIFDQTDG